MTRHERATVGWLQAHGWRQDFSGRWQHPTIAHGAPVTADQAVTAQTRHDRAQAEGARERDILRADLGADDGYREAAMAAIRRVADRLAEFTTDDVLAEAPEIEAAHEPRALGPMMLAAAAAGWIQSTDRMAKSSRRQSNARMKRVWISLLVGGRAAAPVATMDLAKAVAR